MILYYQEGEKMIDLTNSIETFNNYKGSEKKKTLIIDNKKYLVKFPDPIREKNKNISYINNTFSEYIGSNIFKICGFETQNTILGKYEYNGKDKIVCACEDFTDFFTDLFEFENLALSINLDKKIDTEIKDIMEVLEISKNLIDYKNTINKFWEMFIIDALIGNTDRHNGNWGFLLNGKTGEITFSPIYDCGSCLNPILSDEDIMKMDKTELKNIAINCYSCLKDNGKKINYISYIESRKNEECNSALLRVFKNINIKEIIKFIQEIECITNTRKNFYINIINLRYNLLAAVYEELM